MTQRERDEKIYKQSWKNAFTALPIFLICAGLILFSAFSVGEIVSRFTISEDIIYLSMAPVALFVGGLIIWAIEKFWN